MALPAPAALAADGPCAVAERDFNYWVFGSTTAFNTFRAQCAAGKSAPEALIASQRGNPAALAQMRECGAEMVQLLMDRKMDQMCEQFPKVGTAAVSGPPAGQAVPAATPQGDLLATLQGTWCWSTNGVNGQNIFAGTSVTSRGTGFMGAGFSSQGSLQVLDQRSFRITMSTGFGGTNAQDVELVDNDSIRWKQGGAVAKRCTG